jgi:DNA-directed RNA polymerase subunit RPC12/RpoP
MTLQALYCDACGSRDLVRVDDERYRCSHCGASVLVAAEQRASPAAHSASPSQRGPLFGVAGLLLAAVFAVVLWQVNVSSRLPRNEVINASTIELSSARPVQALQGEKARDRLLVMVTNRGTRPVVAPHVAANFYDGTTKLESRSAYAQTSVLRPGESAPVLIEVPPVIAGQPGKAQRHEIALASPLRAVATTDGPVLKFADARLVEREMHFKLAARVQAPTGRSSMQSCRASIVLFDRYDGIVALGDGRCSARDLAPGESTLIDASFVRLGTLPVARWTYHIDYELAQPAPSPALAVAPANRQQMVAGTAEPLIPFPNQKGREVEPQTVQMHGKAKTTK